MRNSSANLQLSFIQACYSADKHTSLPPLSPIQLQAWRSTLPSYRCQVASFWSQFPHRCSTFFSRPMQKGIQPRPVTTQMPKAQPLTEKRSISFGFSQRGRDVVEQPVSQCISARHISRLADRSLLAYGTLDRDGWVAEGGSVIYDLLALRLRRFGVFHCGLCSVVGLGFGVC